MDKHDKYEVVKQAWFEINEHLRNNKQDYIEYLKFSAKMYKQPYSDAVLVSSRIGMQQRSLSIRNGDV